MVRRIGVMFVIVVVILSGSDSVQFFLSFALFMYCRWRYGYQEVRVENPLPDRFNSPHLCASRSQEMDYHLSYVVVPPLFFMLIELS
jgi:hypothetical protein